MHAWADEIHCRLIRMACNLLYRQPVEAEGEPSKVSLDMDQLSLMGGVEIICIEVLFDCDIVARVSLALGPRTLRFPV